MSGSIRVIHVITEIVMGGATDNTLLTVEGLDPEVYSVSLVSSRGGEMYERVTGGGYPVRLLKCLRRAIDPVADLCCVFRLFQIFRSSRCQIVHTHSSKAGFLGRLAAVLAGVPIVVHTVHGWPFNDFMNPIVRRIFIAAEKWAAGLCHRLVMVSELNASEAIDLGIARRSDMKVIYSGIDFTKFRKSTGSSQGREILFRDFGIPGDAPLVGMVGRLFRQKGPDIFVRTAAMVLKSHPHARFVFIGDGPLLSETAELIKSMGLEDRVILTGWRRDAHILLPALDVFLLTSRWEGLGRAITEAAFMGIPIVGARVNGVPEVVRDGVTGFLFEAEDEKTAARHVCTLLDDPELRRRLGADSREWIEKTFDCGVMVDSIDSLYRELLAERGFHLPFTGGVES
ncbi:MAG: hypothetical protein CVV64_04655 [Candidatus Wallbacteria bacterium HGW-Wallbacteria-1]|jgi:glycosyltransferase involved in cell wall biosynthesis|uniref:Glycosyltransferase family 1 protein n=1 Tax=Candidatus Wallbacteria bacterium HGW-Wallbacteria-1 TaxID=2013854 RepID=A0A2N1PRU8_9BACT|nr:MAG: hypothetical protein CVV64_04655 [Candidatus Wallbacteria bacterium HGW-Wallbacteria-1]